MTDEPELRAAIGDERNEVMLWVETFRMTVAGNSDPSDIQQLGYAMAAASIFAGTLLGKLIVAGLVDEKDKRRMTESMAKNYRSGIDIGRKAGLRVAAEMGAGETRQ
jgi:hypothetical protein